MRKNGINKLTVYVYVGATSSCYPGDAIHAFQSRLGFAMHPLICGSMAYNVIGSRTIESAIKKIEIRSG